MYVKARFKFLSFNISGLGWGGSRRCSNVLMPNIQHDDPFDTLPA